MRRYIRKIISGMGSFSIFRLVKFVNVIGNLLIFLYFVVLVILESSRVFLVNRYSVLSVIISGLILV